MQSVPFFAGVPTTVPTTVPTRFLHGSYGSYKTPTFEDISRSFSKVSMSEVQSYNGSYMVSTQFTHGSHTVPTRFLHGSYGACKQHPRLEHLQEFLPRNPPGCSWSVESTSSCHSRQCIKVSSGSVPSEKTYPRHLAGYTLPLSCKVEVWSGHILGGTGPPLRKNRSLPAHRLSSSRHQHCMGRGAEDDPTEWVSTVQGTFFSLGTGRDVRFLGACHASS